MNIFAIISKVRETLALAELLKPILNTDNEILDTVTDVTGRALTGVQFSLDMYEDVVIELDEVIATMNAIRAKGGPTEEDFRTAVANIRASGERLDKVFERLQGTA